MSTKSTATKGHHNGNGAVDELRAVRLAFADKIRDGAEYLQPFFEEIEDALIDALNAARREVTR